MYVSLEAHRTHRMRRVEKRKRVRMQFTASTVTALPNDDSRTREERFPIKRKDYINKKRKKKEKNTAKKRLRVDRSCNAGSGEGREKERAGARKRRYDMERLTCTFTPKDLNKVRRTLLYEHGET